MKEEIRELLPPELLEEIIKVNLERQKKEEEKSRKKQRDEYHRLKYGVRYVDYVNSENNANQLEGRTAKSSKDKVSSIDKSKWVVNVSKRELSEVERRVLEKGAGFAIANKNIPYDDYIVATQQASTYLPIAQALALKADIVEKLQEAKPRHFKKQNQQR